MAEILSKKSHFRQNIFTIFGENCRKLQKIARIFETSVDLQAYIAAGFLRPHIIRYMLYKLWMIIGKFPLLLGPVHQRLKLNVLKFGSHN